MNQHETPCKECPWRRDIQSNALSCGKSLGGSSPEIYIGQAHGSFWLPCHLGTNYSDPNWKQDMEKPQCAGAAIYRANCSVPRRSKILRLRPNTEIVFASPEEFLAHHLNVKLWKAIARLKEKSVAQMVTTEYDKIMKGAGTIRIVSRE